MTNLDDVIRSARSELEYFLIPIWSLDVVDELEPVGQIGCKIFEGFFKNLELVPGGRSSDDASSCKNGELECEGADRGISLVMREWNIDVEDSY